MIKLIRYQSDTYCTLGEMTLPCGYKCHILELPWRNNKRSVSCIPAGTYKLNYRRSPIVERTSEFKFGYEVADVPGRSYIMIHPGNWPENTNGCLLPGQEPQDIGGRLGVPSSRAVFTQLMNRIDSDKIEIVWELDEFPRY